MVSWAGAGVDVDDGSPILGPGSFSISASMCRSFPAWEVGGFSPPPHGSGGGGIGRQRWLAISLGAHGLSAASMEFGLPFAGFVVVSSRYCDRRWWLLVIGGGGCP